MGDWRYSGAGGDGSRRCFGRLSGRIVAQAPLPFTFGAGDDLSEMVGGRLPGHRESALPHLGPGIAGMTRGSPRELRCADGRCRRSKDGRRA